MRVLLESPSCSERSGANGFVGYCWATHLADRVEVHLVTSAAAFADSTVPPGVTVHAIPRTAAAKVGTMLDYQVSARRRKARLLREIQPDVVHSVEPGGWIGPRAFATNAYPYVLGPLNGGGAPAPRSLLIEVMESLPVHPVRNLVAGGPKAVAVNMLNEAVFGSDLPSARALARAAMHKAEQIVLATALSPGAIPARDAHKVVRLPLVGIDLDLFSPRIKHQGPALQALYAGRITPSKGLHLVIEAVARTEATLVIAGLTEEGWYEEHCRSLIATNGLEGRVDWVGPLRRDELAGAYARADVFVMPSLWETYGLGYAEAMASGTPVIGLATGGVPEVVTERTGWLVEPTTKDGIVGRVADLLDMLGTSRDVATMAGDAARAHAKRTWRWDRLVDRMLEIYARARG